MTLKIVHGKTTTKRDRAKHQKVGAVYVVISRSGKALRMRLVGRASVRGLECLIFCRARGA